MKAHAAEVGTSVGLMTTPFWVNTLQEINLILGMAAAIVGLLVGIHALWQIYKGRGEKL